jgi:repressor LexA
MDRDELTAAVYTFVCGFIEEHGYAPSLREISQATFMSPTNVVRYLDRLSAQGRLMREPNVPRSIVLLDENEYG